MRRTRSAFLWRNQRAAHEKEKKFIKWTIHYTSKISKVSWGCSKVPHLHRQSGTVYTFSMHKCWNPSWHSLVSVYIHHFSYIIDLSPNNDHWEMLCQRTYCHSFIVRISFGSITDKWLHRHSDVCDISQTICLFSFFKRISNLFPVLNRSPRGSRFWTSPDLDSSVACYLYLWVDGDPLDRQCGGILNTLAMVTFCLCAILKLFSIRIPKKGAFLILN